MSARPPPLAVLCPPACLVQTTSTSSAGTSQTKRIRGWTGSAVGRGQVPVLRAEGGLRRREGRAAPLHLFVLGVRVGARGVLPVVQRNTERAAEAGGGHGLRPGTGPHRMWAGGSVAREPHEKLQRSSPGVLSVTHVIYVPSTDREDSAFHGVVALQLPRPPEGLRGVAGLLLQRGAGALPLPADR